MNLSVGQIVYAVMKQKAVVYPLLVVKEITERSLDGEAKTYMVRAGADPQKVVPVSAIDGELFSSAAAAKTALVDRATASVSQLVDQAVAKAQEWYPSGREGQSNDPLALIMKQDVAVPAPKDRGPGQVRPELAELAAELQQEAQEVAMVELPGGGKAKVRSVQLPEALR